MKSKVLLSCCLQYSVLGKSSSSCYCRLLFALPWLAILAVMAFDPLTVGFACNRGHTTYQNIVRTGEFVVNVLPEGLAPLAWAIIAFQGQERIDASGLTFLESKRVAVPRIAECTAHLECEFDDAVAFESGEAFVYGRVLAADILSEAVGAGERGYRLLDPCFYLDGGWAGMGAAKRPEA